MTDNTMADLEKRIAKLEAQLNVPLSILRSKPLGTPLSTSGDAPRLAADPLESRFNNVEQRQGDIEKRLFDVEVNYSLVEGIQRQLIENGDELQKVKMHRLSHSKRLTELDERLKVVERRTDPQRFKKTNFPTLDSLVKQIERIFDCKDGEHGAFAQSPVTSPDGPIDNEHLRYRELGYILAYPKAMKQDNVAVESPFEQLRYALMEDFAGIAFVLAQTAGGQSLEKKPTLFWRYAAEARIQEEETGEFEIDSYHYKIRTRVAIPDFKGWEHVRGLKIEGESFRRL